MIGKLSATILSILILISIGYLAKRTNLLKKEHTAVLNPIIVNIAMPALIFRAVYKAQLSISLLITPAFAVSFTLIGLLISYLIGRTLHLKRPTLGAFILMGAIGNTGYLGYPLTIQLFGIENFVQAVFYDLFATVLIMFTLGLVIAERFGEVRERIPIIRELVTFPPLIGFVLALLLRPLVIPQFAVDTIDFLANAAVPLIMLSIGLMLEVGQISNYKKEITAISIIKLGLIPLIALLSMIFVPLSEVLKAIIVLEASMPVFLFSMIIGVKYGLDTDFIPAAAVATTMISLITIPIWQLLVLISTANL